MSGALATHSEGWSLESRAGGCLETVRWIGVQRQHSKFDYCPARAWDE
jgi:hypothetical protein